MRKSTFSSSLTQILTGRSGGALLNASGTFTNVDGSTIGNFNGYPVYAKVVNGTLSAWTYDQAGGALQWKPPIWLVNAGLLSESDAAKYSSTNPNGSGGIAGPATTNTPAPTPTPTPGTGSGLLGGILGGTTNTGNGTGNGGSTQQPMNAVVLLLIVGVACAVVYYLAKKK